MAKKTAAKTAKKKRPAMPGAGRPSAFPGRSKEAPLTIKLSAEAKAIADRRAAERGLEDGIGRAYNRSEYFELLARDDAKRAAESQA